jgi:predicted nucleic acid-binding protein
LDNIWNDCILVLDTNIYLNLINYPQTLSDELIKIFNSYNHENRLFVPNTVAEEVIKQIDKQLDSLNNSYTTIDSKIDNSTLAFFSFVVAFCNSSLLII